MAFSGNLTYSEFRTILSKISNPTFSMAAFSLRLPTTGGQYTVGFRPGQTLAQAIYLSGFFVPPALCSGLGRCGRCRVRFLRDAPSPDPKEIQILNEHTLEAGWRLGCRRQAAPDLLLSLPEDIRPAEDALPGVEQQTPPHFPPPVIGGLAVDFGTTSLHARLCGPGYPPDSPPRVEINPQMGAGSEVMSRLAFAATPEGADRLRGLALGALQRLARQASVPALCLAANPAMTYLVLGLDCSGLSFAPYRLNYHGGVWEALPGLPPVWIAPLISPFVGGDLSAGYASLAFAPDRPAPEYPFLLADLGTNGEFILALGPDQALAASVPMGPALEGIGLSLGTEARPGAANAFILTPLGLEARTIGNGPAVGICGAGYLSLAARLLKSGLLSRQGRFAYPKAPPANAQTAPGQAAPNQLRLPGRLFISADDIEEILKVKAAFGAALTLLLREAGLKAASLRRIFLAGALGLHISPSDLEETGFIPPGLGRLVTPLGNSSLAGAELFLTHPPSREPARAWARRVRTLELAGNQEFSDIFMRKMYFDF